MKYLKLILISSILLILTGCQTLTQTDNSTCNLKDQYACTSGELSTSSSSLVPSPGSIDQSDPLQTAKQIIQTLANNNIDTFIQFIDPSAGIRFSPYSFVNKEDNIVTKKEQFKSDFDNTSKIILRGYYDGSGEPINLSTKDYFAKFVYDADFMVTTGIYENQKISRGNIINNIFDVYTNGYIVEFFIPGIDPQYEGMDWRSLTLVLQNKNNKRYLIAIIHGQRTI